MFEPISKYEHFKGKVEGIKLPLEESFEYCFPKKRDPENSKCFSIQPFEECHHLTLSYFIGIDWIVKKEQAIYVEPKLNKSGNQTNYLKMLFSALKHPEIAYYTDDLFVIKLNDPLIEIQQQQDLLTPLLVVQFLKVVQEIVRKGLKKSFYKVEQNLNSRIKGKILTGKTIKQDLYKNKVLHTYCSFEEFGYDGFENRLLKKALLFVQRYLPVFKFFDFEKFTADTFNYIVPAFSLISDEVNLNDVKHNKPNVFYKEYAEGIRLAKLILSRFGYNITNAQQRDKIKTPPFWIDMSKLFELYVLGLLKDRYGKAVEYHFISQYNELDFFLNTPSEKFVIDAKYRPLYEVSYDIKDIRQVSGYSRIKRVVKRFGYVTEEEQGRHVIDCLIVYPDQSAEMNIDQELKKEPIPQFVKFYKYGVRLPEIR